MDKETRYYDERGQLTGYSRVQGPDKGRAWDILAALVWGFFALCAWLFQAAGSAAFNLWNWAAAFSTYKFPDNVAAWGAYISFNFPITTFKRAFIAICQSSISQNVRINIAIALAITAIAAILFRLLFIKYFGKYPGHKKYVVGVLMAPMTISVLILAYKVIVRFSYWLFQA
jgi:hypothetical protein